MVQGQCHHWHFSADQSRSKRLNAQLCAERGTGLDFLINVSISACSFFLSAVCYFVFCFFHPSIHPCIYHLSMDLAIQLSIQLSINLSIYQSINPSINLSIHLSIYQSMGWTLQPASSQPHEYHDLISGSFFFFTFANCPCSTFTHGLRLHVFVVFLLPVIQRSLIAMECHARFPRCICIEVGAPLFPPVELCWFLFLKPPISGFRGCVGLHSEAGGAGARRESLQTGRLSQPAITRVRTFFSAAAWHDMERICLAHMQPVCSYHGLLALSFCSTWTYLST